MENMTRTLEEDSYYSDLLTIVINFGESIAQNMFTYDELDSMCILDFIEYLLTESNEIHLISNNRIKNIYLITSYYLYDYPKLTNDIRKKCHNIITLTNRLMSGQRDLEKSNKELNDRTNLSGINVSADNIDESYNSDTLLYFALCQTNNDELIDLNICKTLLTSECTINSIVNIINKHSKELTKYDVQLLKSIMSYKMVLCLDCQNVLPLYNPCVKDGKCVTQINFDDKELAHILKTHDAKCLEEIYYVLDDVYRDICASEKDSNAKKLMKK